MKKKTNILKAAALLLTAVTGMSAAACGKTDASSGTSPLTAQAADLTASITPQKQTAAEPTEEFCAGQTAFALKLMQETLKNKQNNVLISPYSVMQALAMTANGAKNDTLSEMEQVLGGQKIADLNSALLGLRNSQPNSETCKLLTANSVWMRDTEHLTVQPEFLQKTADYYGAEAYKAPFDENTCNAINDWVNVHTDRMIPKVLNEINPQSMLYLINAVTFDAKWADKYTNEPRDREFTALGGQKQTAQMMYSTEKTYLSDEYATGFMKQYEGGRYAFAALLPDEGMSVNDYIATLTPESLRTTLCNPKHCEVNAGLPKFSYDFGDELSDQLKSMGMQKAFLPSADFSGMADDLYIGEVIHKTHIEVDTKGTKAAAVTVVEMRNNDAMIADETKTVVLDRPFLYMIVDTETCLPIFLGTLTELP